MVGEQQVFYDPGPRNYFRDASNAVDGLKYRLDGKDIISDIELTLRGGEVLKNGQVSIKPENALMNETGIHHTKVWLRSAFSKITHLTKFENTEHINKQQRWLAKDWAFMITLHRKEWGIKDKDAVQMLVEKQMYESMLRANEGFENVNISRSHSTHENIDRSQPQSQGWGFGRFRIGGG